MGAPLFARNTPASKKGYTPLLGTIISEGRIIVITVICDECERLIRNEPFDPLVHVEGQEGLRVHGYCGTGDCRPPARRQNGHSVNYSDTLRDAHNRSHKLLKAIAAWEHEAAKCQSHGCSACDFADEGMYLDALALVEAISKELQR